MYASPYYWWVQSVMPVVFDNSLSYYEVLAKLTNYMEGIIKDVDQIEKILATIEGIEDVTQFVEFLESIQAEIGTLENLSTTNKSDLVSAINEVALKANNAYVKPVSGIPEVDLSQEVRDKLNSGGGGGGNSYIINNKTLLTAPSNNTPDYLGLGTYSVPEGGIPESTLSAEVRAKLNSGGGGGTTDYTELINKPQINGHTLNAGNNSGQSLGLGTGDYTDLSNKPQINGHTLNAGDNSGQSLGLGTGDYTDLSNKPQINGHTLSAGNNSSQTLGLGTYSKPIGGIPESDLADTVVNKLNTSSAIATENVGTIAQRNYETGELVYINGVLYKATMDILTGSNFVVGTNIVATDINDELLEINSKIDTMASGQGLDSWSISAILKGSGASVEQNFFEYIRCTGGEDYLFIVNRSRYAATFVLKIYARDGTLIDTQTADSTSYNDYRFTFTPEDTGDYYCAILMTASGSDNVYVTVTVEYTQSQGITELWNQVNAAQSVVGDVAALESLVEQNTGDVSALKSALYKGEVILPLPITQTQGYYYESTTTHKVLTNDSDQYSFKTVLENSEEYLYYITLRTTSASDCIIYADENDNVIGKDLERIPATIKTDYLLTVPSGCKKIYITGYSGGSPTTNIGVKIKKQIYTYYVSPEMFGAKGDGTTDDYNAFTKAIATGLPIRLQPKTYYLSHGLKFEKSINFEGSGMLGVSQSNCTVLEFANLSNDWCITIDGCKSGTFGNLTIKNHSSHGSDLLNAIHFTNGRSSYTVFHDIYMDDIKKGILVDTATAYNKFERVQIIPRDDNAILVEIGSADYLVTDIQPNYINFIDCWFGSNTNFEPRNYTDVLIRNGQHLLFERCDFVAPKKVFHFSTSTVPSRDIKIINNWFYAINTAFYFENNQPVTSIDVHDNSFIVQINELKMVHCNDNAGYINSFNQHDENIINGGGSLNSEMYTINNVYRFRSEHFNNTFSGNFFTANRLPNTYVKVSPVRNTVPIQPGNQMGVTIYPDGLGYVIAPNVWASSGLSYQMGMHYEQTQNYVTIAFQGSGTFTAG